MPTSTQNQLVKARKERDRQKLHDAMMAQIKAMKVPCPVTEYQFAAPRKWRFDMAWLVDRVALELHGGVYIQGGHTRGQGFTRNREKANEAQLLGWTVLEVTPEHIKSGQALQWLLRALPEMPRPSHYTLTGRQSYRRQAKGR